MSSDHHNGDGHGHGNDHGNGGHGHDAHGDHGGHGHGLPSADASLDEILSGTYHTLHHLYDPSKPHESFGKRTELFEQFIKGPYKSKIVEESEKLFYRADGHDPLYKIITSVIDSKLSSEEHVISDDKDAQDIIEAYLDQFILKYHGHDKGMKVIAEAQEHYKHSNQSRIDAKKIIMKNIIGMKDEDLGYLDHNILMGKRKGELKQYFKDLTQRHASNYANKKLAKIQDYFFHEEDQHHLADHLKTKLFEYGLKPIQLLHAKDYRILAGMYGGVLDGAHLKDKDFTATYGLISVQDKTPYEKIAEHKHHGGHGGHGGHDDHADHGHGGGGHH
ncbi:MAG: hypothetical protein QW594_04255 [Candidatus Woesearchaeota archaeon]